tara:strand:- start:1301 stop:2164 length:864 start_codon:yes stop_codon:yes gene_type:complete
MDTQSILKKRVDFIIEESLLSKNDEDVFLHLLVISDSVKSLIGINVEAPPLNLLDWIEREVKMSDKKDSPIKFQKPEIRTVSYKQLQEALINRDRKLIENILLSLQSVTDGTQLSEFLLEMSLLQTGKSFISVWRIYKAMNFINLDDNFPFYRLMCEVILKDGFREESINNKKPNYLVTAKYLNMLIYSHILDCRSCLFIRQRKVLAALDGMLSYITLENKIKNSISLHQDSERKDRGSVLNKIENNNLKLSKKNILLLDSIRMLIKNAPKVNDELIFSMYEQLKDT